MFGTYERFNLIRSGYTRSGSNAFISEDFYKPGLLRFGNNWSSLAVNTIDFLFDIKLTINGTPVKYSYFADEGSLIMKAYEAEVEIALTDRSHVRIRGENAGVRLELRSASGNGARACRGMYALPDGTGWEGEFGRYGKLFFKAISGNFNVAFDFDYEKNEYSYLRIDFIPDVITGEFEAAIHDYRGDAQPEFAYEDFDEVVECNRAEFAEFRKLYREPAIGYEEMTKYAEWIIWSLRTKAIGIFKQPHILMQIGWSSIAAPWQQSYNAMAMLNGPDEAWRLACLMYLYQNKETGRLPGMLTFAHEPMEGMQPAFEGFALDFLCRNLGDDFITAEEAERVYPMMSKWANYWTKFRNAGTGSDLVAIRSPHESGWDDSSIFKDGFPAIDPSASAFLVLLMEIAAKVAKKSFSYSDMYEEWMLRAKKLTDIIINEFWDGEKFVSKVDGKPVDALSLANYQPIILGKRLPQEIIDKVAEKLVVHDHWLTDIGLASESMQSELATFGVSFVCGRVVGPLNMIITVGLQSAGKQKEADYIARRFCDHVNREGIILGYAPYNYYKFNGEKADQQIPPHLADGWTWSTWTANCFLTMVTGIIGK